MNPAHKKPSLLFSSLLFSSLLFSSLLFSSAARAAGED
ncbi:Opacity protein opA54, partial [Neisseria gonorrhoeae]